MSTSEMIIELEQMARQCIDAPKSKAFFTEVAARLEYLDKWNEQLRDEKDCIADDPAGESEEEP